SAGSSTSPPMRTGGARCAPGCRVDAGGRYRPPPRGPDPPAGGRRPPGGLRGGVAPRPLLDRHRGHRQRPLRRGGGGRGPPDPARRRAARPAPPRHAGLGGRQAAADGRPPGQDRDLHRLRRAQGPQGGHGGRRRRLPAEGRGRHRPGRGHPPGGPGGERLRPPPGTRQPPRPGPQDARPRADPPGVRGPAPGGHRRDQPRDRRGHRPVPQHGEDLSAVGPPEARGPQPGGGHRPGQRVRPALNVRDLDTAHSRIKEYAWEPDYFARRPLRETKYRIPRRSKDPFRHLLRDYVTMEEEKDNRQYGALEDVVARTRSPERAQHRWMEVLKPLLSMTTCAEYAAVKCMASLVDTVDNPELRQGYVAQMLDEMRHTNQETYLIRYLSRHAPDPAGFNSALSSRSVNPLIRAARGAVFDVFLNEDPLTCSVQVQVVGEAGYTNAVFVAATEIAAANDDPATPSVFLNIQSDEVRHMANGYATLSALLAEPDNLPTLQRDFDAAFWRLHVFMDSFLGVVYDYFPKVRLRSYREYWEQWIWQDWIGGYVERL